ncbi:MAG: hypothetical protein H6741_17250 [Alphaproteobacteria bacterium]|nr:hypothetical protein [Alphaproteobacteria bacterium]MCB9794464.1 hypothetical protein [Alphaproteobacteria bacterium]
MQALLFLLLSAPAWAEPSLSEARVDGLDAASHVGHVEGERVRWSSTLDFGRVGVVALAWPLPEGSELVRCSGAVPLLDAQGRLAGLRSDSNQTAFLEVETPLDPSLLTPPLILDASAPQRVALDEAWFRAGPESGLTWGMAHQSAPELGARERRAADSVSRQDLKRLGSQPLYLVADGRLASLGGVPGELREAGEVPAQTAFAVGGIFLLVLAGLVAVARGLAQLARKEQVERYIRSELGVSPE